MLNEMFENFSCPWDLTEFFLSPKPNEAGCSYQYYSGFFISHLHSRVHGEYDNMSADYYPELDHLEERCILTHFMKQLRRSIWVWDWQENCVEFHYCVVWVICGVWPHNVNGKVLLKRILVEDNSA